MKQIKLNTVVALEEAKDIASSFDEEVLSYLDEAGIVRFFASLYRAIKVRENSIKSIKENELKTLRERLNILNSETSKEETLNKINDEDTKELFTERSSVDALISKIETEQLKPLEDDLKAFKVVQKVIKSNPLLINFIKDEGEVGLVYDDEVLAVSYPKVSSASYEFAEGIDVEDACNNNEVLSSSVVASYLIVPSESNLSELDRLCDEGILIKKETYEVKTSTSSSKIRTFDSSCEDISEGGE